jgi:hypothetical protein
MLSPLLVAAAIPVACPIQDARYGMRENPAITARFHAVRRTSDWSSGLALAIRIGSSGRTYWWLPWNGGTDRRLHVASVRERNQPEQLPEGARPLGDLDFFSTTNDYAFLPAVPQRGERAPAHFFIPHLGRTLWTGLRWDRRDDAPTSFFDLVDCRPPPSGEREPDIEFPAVP